MTSLSIANTQPFSEQLPFEEKGIRHTVFKKGRGAGVLLLHELPGMGAEFWRLANWLAEHFTVYAPDLFGNSDRPTPESQYRSILRACISREIHLFAKDDPGPITQWLRALSKVLHVKTGGPGVGVIGMCMTGNFALTLALDPWVAAPIASQPALPISLPFREMNAGLQMTQQERATLEARDVDVMALRFAGDKLCRAARFDTIRELVGEARFKEHVIDDIHRAPGGQLKHAHSVLTSDLVDNDDSVTKQKLLEVIGFLKDRIEA
jgi:dienelactone hydrolase